MKQKFLFLGGLLVLSSFLSYGQTNEFKIGMFGFKWMKDNNGLPMTTTTNQQGFNTSNLNVLVDDGFNTVLLYNPDWWTTEDKMTAILTLIKANGEDSDNDLKILVNAMHYYWPENDNEYDNNNFARPNYDSFVQNVYSDSDLQNTIWGHQVTEEAAYDHLFNPDNVQPSAYADPPLGYYEVPYENVNQAMIHFREIFDNEDIEFQKLIMMDAAHGRSICDDFDSGKEFDPQDYLNILNKPDVFLEGSYKDFAEYPYNPKDYSNIATGGFHYLGFLKSIDYSQDYVPDVHKVLNIEGDFNFTIHSNPDTYKNANWLWFKSYASIIHGANGIWFWELNDSFRNCEMKDILISNTVITESGLIDEVINTNSNTYPNLVSYDITCDSYEIVTNEDKSSRICDLYRKVVKSHFEDYWITINDRFDDSQFSLTYQDFVSHLAQELRYLVNLGLLSSDPGSIVCSKTDEIDNYKVLPADKYYLPLEYKSDNYDLRYTVRTNGNEVVMIIANPTLESLYDVTIDFSNIPNAFVKNATTVDVLFSSQPNINAEDYKEERNSGIDLEVNTVNIKYPLDISSCNQLTMSFGPLDVHVLKFRKNFILSTWEEVATEGFYSSSNSDIAVEINGDNRKIYYVREDGIIANTYNNEFSWRNSWFPFPNFPKSQTDCGLVWNETNEELFYISETNKTVCRIFWNGTGWEYEYTAGINVRDGSDIAIDQFNKVYYVRSDGFIGATFRYGDTWSNTWFPDFPKVAQSSGLFWNDSNNELFYVEEQNKTICRIYWTGENWEKELTAGYSAMSNSDIAVDQFGHVFYIGEDGIIQYTYKQDDLWFNGWFPEFPKAKSGSGIQWNSTNSELYYIGDDDNIHCIYYSNGWNKKTITNTCDELGQYNLAYYDNKICYVGQDNIIHEFTNYSPQKNEKCFEVKKSNSELISQKNELLVIYPIPSNNTLYFEGNSNPISIEIYNSLGKLILVKSDISNSLDISGISGGIYIIRITSSWARITKKIIIQ